MADRFNPFTEAIRNARAGVGDLMRQTPPPREVLDAVQEYDRRINDPGAALPEWRAIHELHGYEGVLGYMQDMKRLKETWGL